ncbi:hypothetical protein OBBRIDRAFT_832839 [Obba rivulosa]|uniref:Uncharacterized protein n=1 Tax=Obba rivulosa TaxID=1052685 RepID=A0A8E2DP64_9APHY|nr:hypothetical protein OBBRIDRAFT_832839 [Obba rivulosa]
MDATHQVKGYSMESEYWTHCEMFPHNRFIPPKVVEELRRAMLNATAGTLTSDTPTTPFTHEELSKMSELLKLLQYEGHCDAHSASVLARFMKYIAEKKFYNFHGQPDARLSSDQSVFCEEMRGRSFMIRVLSLLLFNAPDIHAREFRKVWVDRLINHVTWKQFITKLTAEWQDFTLYNTVLLNANVALLAVPGIIPDSTDQSSAGNPSQNAVTPAQISSYLSILASFGSIIMGLLLMRQNRMKGRDNVETAIAFLRRVTHVETLAFIYSLPYALLMWSMILFIAAAVLRMFQHLTTVTNVLVGVVSGAVALLVLWAIVAGWHSEGSD